MPRLHIDLETFSPNPIKQGVYKYAQGADILIVAYYDSWSNEQSVLNTVEQPGRQEALHLLKAKLADSSYTFHAHNAMFERVMIREVFGLDIPATRWRCTMIAALYCGLPASLGNLSKALTLDHSQQKQTGISSIMRYFTTPCEPTPLGPNRTRRYPGDNPKAWDRFMAYCYQDVTAERAVYEALSDYELLVDAEFTSGHYALDQEINDRGVPIDLDLAQHALEADSYHTKQLTSEIQDIIGSAYKANSPTSLKAWFERTLGRTLNSLDKKSLQSLTHCPSPIASYVAKLRLKASGTSAKKFQTMLDCNINGRVHGTLQYYGASTTGRWAGRLIQVQNFPRGSHGDDQVKQIIDDLKSGRGELLDLLHGDAKGALKSVLRPAIRPATGKMLVVCDYSAIEARVLAWLAGEDWRLGVFDRNGDIYKASASEMYNIPIEDVDKELRQKGKIAELALGYGGSVGAIKAFGADSLNMSDSEIQGLVQLWRNRNPNVCEFWRTVENACLHAVKAKESGREGRVPIKPEHNLYAIVDKRTLRISLPSGRELVYWNPRIGRNQFDSECVTYASELGVGLSRTDTYGGKLVENITQAVARELLMQCLVDCSRGTYTRNIIMHVHDEVVIEVDQGDADKALKEVVQLMSTPPNWAEGLPLNAEGFKTEMYRKD